MACAQTGSGKTAANMLPAMQNMLSEGFAIAITHNKTVAKFIVPKRLKINNGPWFLTQFHRTVVRHAIRHPKA